MEMIQWNTTLYANLEKKICVIYKIRINLKIPKYLLVMLSFSLFKVLSLEFPLPFEMMIPTHQNLISRNSV